MTLCKKKSIKMAIQFTLISSNFQFIYFCLLLHVIDCLDVTEHTINTTIREIYSSGTRKQTK